MIKVVITEATLHRTTRQLSNSNTSPAATVGVTAVGSSSSMPSIVRYGPFPAVMSMQQIKPILLVSASLAAAEG